MEIAELVTIEHLEVDMLCEACDKEITVGEDIFYDQKNEEYYCEQCVNRKFSNGDDSYQ
ncbi:MAG: Zn finger protein HypA/HybF involved in hydrogenase expression [Cyclobacteriaceae bacterium]|jgi:Zn finger protein HypA/HybF involved in hydrogenase expression